MQTAKQLVQTKLGIDIKLLEVNETIKLLPAALAASATPTSSAINMLIGAFESLLEKREAASGSPPVICIDEVNVLMDWFEGDRALQTDLDALLRFFVQITKVKQRAHVILATSEYSFLTWLQSKVKVGFFITEVIGDFPEPEAREFFQGLLSNNRDITDTQWTSVFEASHRLLSPVIWCGANAVCGGNAGLLTTTARLIRSNGDVQEGWSLVLAVHRVQHYARYADMIPHLCHSSESGLAPTLYGEDRPWGSEQYRTMLRLICESDHAAVIVTDAHRELKPDGEQAVQAMVKADLLAYRPASAWARDIPLEAFGPEQEAVLTAPTATHLYCMRRLQGRGCTQVLEQQFQNLGGEITRGKARMKVLRITQPEGWEDELAYLRKKDKQLLEKELLLLRKQRQEAIAKRTMEIVVNHITITEGQLPQVSRQSMAALKRVFGHDMKKYSGTFHQKAGNHHVHFLVAF
eukprot:jgi/Astpho2/6778/Aster-07223